MSQDPTYDNYQAELYKNWFPYENLYRNISGKYIIPLASGVPENEEEYLSLHPDDRVPFVVIQVHRPFRSRRYRFDVQKNNNPPVIPKPDDEGKFVHVDSRINFSTGTSTNYNTYNWEVKGDYLYFEQSPHSYENGYILGGPPFNQRVAISSILTMISLLPTLLLAGPAALALLASIIGSSDVVKLSYLFGLNNNHIAHPDGRWIYPTLYYYPGKFFTSGMIS